MAWICGRSAAQSRRYAIMKATVGVSHASRESEEQGNPPMFSEQTAIQLTSDTSCRRSRNTVHIEVAARLSCCTSHRTPLSRSP